MTMCDITAIEDTIKDKMLTDWRKEASKKPKLRTYVTLKDNIEVEHTSNMVTIGKQGHLWLK